MPGVEITVAIIQVAVEGVIENGGAVLADLIQGMGPGVGKL